MATKQWTADFLVEQMLDAGHVTSRKMFGEYAIYCDQKVVALICDDRLFVKPTAEGKTYMKQFEMVPPYPGAKPYLLIPDERWDDAAWLCQLIRITTDALPLPRKKR